MMIVPAHLAGKRLDAVLAQLMPELSRSRLKSLVEAGAVTLDGATVTDAKTKVLEGQVANVTVPEATAAEPQAQEIALDIVYEDKDLLVLNKPAGLVVHPAAGHADGTLVNALLHHCGDSLSGIGGVRRPGIVHRLDKDTSGLMLVAKNDAAHAGLSAQLADRTMSRTYQALVWGVPKPPKGRIDAPIDRHPRLRLLMAVRPEGRNAATNYRVLETFGPTAALVECKLETGRTHQIRVHLSHLKHPVIGDPLYGLQKSAVQGYLKRAGTPAPQAEAIHAFPRQALHAVALAFDHPRTGKPMAFEVPLAPDIVALAARFTAPSEP